MDCLNFWIGIYVNANTKENIGMREKAYIRFLHIIVLIKKWLIINPFLKYKFSLFSWSICFILPQILERTPFHKTDSRKIDTSISQNICISSGLWRGQVEYTMEYNCRNTTKLSE